MEQHPVPQNVTGFEFKLIGDMTVKQFIFLAGGVLLAYFITRTGWLEIFKWPLALFSFLGGFSLAFMPIEERPLDIWVTNFFTSCYKPTLFLWQKKLVIPEILTSLLPLSSTTFTAVVSGEKKPVEEFLQSLPQKESSPLDEEQKNKLEDIQNNLKILSGKTVSIPLPSEEPALKIYPGITIPTEVGTKIIPRVGKIQTHALRPIDLTKNPVPSETTIGGIETPIVKEPQIEPELPPKEKVVPIEVVVEEPKAVHMKMPTSAKETPIVKEAPSPKESEEIESLKRELADLTAKASLAQGEEAKKASADLVKLEERLAEVLVSQKGLEEELNKARRALKATPKEEVVVPKQVIEEEKKEATTVKFVPQSMAATIGVVQPTIPNVISGIIKDESGEILTNILVEVRDKDYNPVRALKNNRLGQFAVATPLPNGTYTVHFEDIRGVFQFDIIEVVLDGKIFPPMEIRAKSQTDVEREKLKEALFGKQI